MTAAKRTSRRRGWPAALRWPLWGLAMLLVLAGFIGLWLNRATPLPSTWGVEAGTSSFAVVLDQIGQVVLVPAFVGGLGLLIVGRRPDNQIGWLLGALALVAGISGVLFEYTVYSLFTAPGSLPGGTFTAWLMNWEWVLPNTVAFWIALVFPDGRLEAAGWRGARWLVVLSAVIVVVQGMLEPQLSAAFFQHNPLPLPELGSWFEWLTDAAYLSFVLAVGGTAISVVRRFRRARGVERQQFKWFAAAAVAAGVMTPVGLFLGIGLGRPEIGGLLVDAGFAALPLAVGVAVLRYRLYDLDLVINRTLVYGSLTAALAAVYFGGVVMLQAVFRSLTGENSQLAVVGSTLAIAALFSPLRRWVQDFIDRRFYRRKYDAARTLAEFAATARDETDLDRLAERLVGVVEETMQPQQVRLWLASGEVEPQSAEEEAGK